MNRKHQFPTPSPTGDKMIDLNFDRKNKAYQWTDPTTGEIFNFPGSGPAVKSEAWRFAISMLDPDIYQTAVSLIDRFPTLERVVWRGVERLLNGDVEILAAPVGDVVAMVASQSDVYGRHAIKNEDGYITCDCYAFVNMEAPLTPNGRRVCSHIAAYRLALTREERF